jgi:hypothetical protein
MQSRPAKYRKHTRQRSIVLHRNNTITKNYRIFMVCYYLNEKVMCDFAGLENHKNVRVDLVLRFLKTSTHVPRFSVLKLHGIIKSVKYYVSLKASQACQHPTQHSLYS